MKAPDGFTFWVDDDALRVVFVPAGKLGRLDNGGHATGGDYLDGLIRLPRYEARKGLRSSLLHELGHHLVRRQELNPRGTQRALPNATEEDVCDLLTWIPMVLVDPRNDALRAFLGVALA